MSDPEQSVRAAVAAATAPVLVGFSGGLDSTVLLHALAASPALRAQGLRAIHVHHGLIAAAERWTEHCIAACARWDVTLEVRHVQVPLDSGLGMEGAARRARRRAFAETLQAGEWLALAHHQDDQAETFLLRALRASGPDGLAAMRAQAPFAAGILWRPLLELPRAALEAYARQHGLHWIEDPSNADDRFDRNYLRHHVLPLLRRRWPQADAALAGSARLCAEAVELLDDEDTALLQGALHADGTLQVEPLAAQPPARRARLLRRWVTARCAPPLPAHGVAALERLLDREADGAEASFRWRDREVRRWRDALHLLVLPLPELPPNWQAGWDGQAPLALPDGTRLSLEGAKEGFGSVLQVRPRRGGERIVLPGRSHSHALKHVLQDAGIAPWQRPVLPLLYEGERLLAAGDRILAAPFAQWLRERGARLRWRTPN
ncbi:tRNA lysidine(34) synthetase TilS [Stenotrophomonas sp. MMGLT7]|uniref:tRNA lysidine(34) synthetase TilS n=1 Tax=Stenotrophomonas sp. MMGLT7 TaxID=2901227 RepID=UPI001E3CD19B|nr:tRNA lysidine(34) synthetase TilS [Stenotrophomonas sp. MMGLT7]MCD7099382.1 tRNA lysidine(34) synthetase TilS [Stenotrophomonas sp. MMGLT7]